MNMEQRWNDIDMGKPKDSEKNLTECHFVRHKSHMNWPEREPGPRGEKPATNRLSYGTAEVGLYRATLRNPDSALRLRW
jgi:hypothetical protein